MGVDYDSELGDTWARMVHDRLHAGLPVRTRPAVDRREQQLADEVNRHMARIVTGYEQRGEEPATLARACHRCGSIAEPLVNVGAVYSRSGKLDRWRCADYCQE